MISCNYWSGHNLRAYQCSLARISKVHVLWNTKDVSLDAVEISCTSTRTHVLLTGIVRPSYKLFNSANGKNFSSQIPDGDPTLSIAVSETMSTMGDRNDGSRNWKSLGSNQPHCSLHNFNKIAYCHYSAIMWHHNRYFTLTNNNSTHPTWTVEQTFDVKN